MSIDPDALLNQAHEDANSTRLIPFPEGEFQAVIQSVEAVTFTFKKGERAGQEGVRLVVEWEATDESVREIMKRDPKIRQNIFLDLDGGNLDMSEGRNITLGRLREAVGMNQEGQAFAMSSLEGQTAIIRVSHRMDEENIRADVTGTTAI